MEALLLAEVDIPYHRSPNTSRNRVSQELRDFLPQIRGGTILDFGCSYGFTTRELAELYPECQVLGIECVEGRITVPSGRNFSFAYQDGFKLDPSIKFKGVFALQNVGYMLSRAHPGDITAHYGYMGRLCSLVQSEGVLVISGYPGKWLSTEVAVLRRLREPGLRFEFEKSNLHRGNGASFAVQLEGVIDFLNKHSRFLPKSF